MNEKSATKIIEEVKDAMCMHYCRYTNQSKEALDQDQVYEKCEDCPLNRL